MNLIGEHTDYNDGLVLPMAINRWTCVAIAANDVSHSRLVSDDLNQCCRIDLRAPIEPVDRASDESFANHILGMASAIYELGASPINVDMMIHSTLPIGAGLSSSASLEISAGLALSAMCNQPVSREVLARMAQRTEHEFVGTPCGIMDMTIVAGARKDSAMLLDCRTMDLEYIPMPTAEDLTVLIVDTGVRHDLRDGAYADRRESCGQAASMLGVTSLRDVTIDQLSTAALPPLLMRRAEHVVNEIERTRQFADALQSRSYTQLGKLMEASHRSLHDLFEVSCDALDAVVKTASAMRGDGGVCGARMTGGGFGGCVIILAQPSHAESIAKAVALDFEAQFARTPAIYQTNAVGAAGRDS